MAIQDAATQLKVPLETIIKSILLLDEEDVPVLATLTGDRRVDRKKLSSAVGASKVRMATPEATRVLTGFELALCRLSAMRRSSSP